MKPPATRVIRTARRAWPVVLMGWERWQALPPERKEHYKQQARSVAERGRKSLEQRGRRHGKR
jgi:TRAP-type C4-dicarboxylate transport system substrate-binding protein